MVVVLSFTVEFKESLKGELHSLDLTLTQNEFYLEEEDFEVQMKEVVEPYLEQYCEEGTFSPEEGITIAYRSYFNDKASKAIVISHGFTESMAKYRETIYYFLQGGYSVYIMDHLGHGYSTRLVEDKSMVHVEDFNDYVNYFASFVKTIVKPQIGENECYLFAHSMGGGIGARVLEEYPELFDKAVLSAPMLKVDTGYTQQLSNLIVKVARLLGQDKKYLFGQGAFDGISNFSESASNSEARYAYCFAARLEDENNQAYGGSFSWLEQSLKGTKELRKEENLSKIQIPVLVFQAENDGLVLPEGHYEFVNGVESAELLFVPETKHEIYASTNKTMIPYFNTIFAFYE